MSDTVQLAIVAGVMGVIMALVSAVIQWWLKQQDWARQDIVAARVEAATKLLSEGQEKAATLLVENNKKVADTAAKTELQLGVIHTLVNSTLTASMQAELVATRRLLVAFQKEHLTDPSHGLSSEIVDVQGRIAELEAKLKDRLAAAHSVERQQENAARQGVIA